MKRRNLFIIITWTFCLQSFPLFPNITSNNFTIESLLAEISIQKDDTSKVNKYLALLDLDLSNTKVNDSTLIQEALNTSKKIQWKEGEGRCYFYMGWADLLKGHADHAILCFQNAINYSSDSTIVVYSYGMISNTYSWMLHEDLALSYAQKAVDYISGTNLNLLKAESLTFLGDAYRYSRCYDEASECYQLAASLLEQNNEYTHSYQYLLLRMYQNSNSLESFFIMLDFIGSLRDYYENANFIEKQLYILSLTKLSMIFSVKTEQEQQALTQLAAKEKETLTYLIGITVLLILVGLLIWEINSKRKSNKELIKTNEFKSRFIAILNHDLRRPIAGLLNVLSFKSANPAVVNETDVAFHEERNIKMTQNLLDNMDNLLFWCKDQMQAFKPEFYHVSVDYLFNDLQSFFSYETDVELIFNYSPDMKIYTDEEYLKTIMRNLTSNAINAQKGINKKIIEWHAFHQSFHTLLSIKNHGKIIKKEEIETLLGKTKEKNIKKGLGLIIIHDLAKSINCNIKIASNKEDGTIITLVFKKKT